MKRSLSILILSLLAVSTSGCVYFNVFYNAKRRFQEAEKYRFKAEETNDRNAMRTAEEVYFQAISKASALIDLHPGSKYVDDSLMLIGKAEFWREHYMEALRKFAELQSNFPRSLLLEESHLWEGRAYWKMGRPADAQRVLRALAYEGRSVFSDQAAFALLEIQAGQKAHRVVVEEGEALVGRLRGAQLRAAVLQKIGESQVALKEYGQAEATFQSILKHSSTAKQEYDARNSLGGILTARGEFTQASEWFRKMLGIKPLRRRFEADIRLSLAETLYRLGKDDEATRLCKGVVTSFPRTSQAAVAYYRMGLIAERAGRKTDEVRELLRKAQQENRESPVWEVAGRRQEDLGVLERYLKEITADSTGVRSLDTVFNLAELYRLRLEEPDSALSAYRRVVDRDTTRSLAPKASYAIGWILAEMKRDTVAAGEAFRTTIRDFPGTSFAEAANAWLGGGGGTDDAARGLYLEAEALRLSGSDPKTFLPILDRIAAEFPGNIYAVRALYARAWTYENVLRDEKAARGGYGEVAARFPQLDLGDLAKRKIDAMVSQAREDSVRLSAAADSLRRSAEQDSLRRMAVADSLKGVAASDTVRAPSQGAQAAEAPGADTSAVQAPRVAETAPVVYPDSLKQYPTEVIVTLNVLVGTDGSVKEAVATRGPERYYQAAIATVRQYLFIPGGRQGHPEEMWAEQTVQFLPP